MSTVQPRRVGRWLLRIALSVSIFAVALELGVRFILFSDTAARWPIAHALREPQRFARNSSDDLYWQLAWNFESPELRGQAPNYDPMLGWKSDKILEPDWRHSREDELGSRRPILFFGDSYVACMTPSEECFEGLFATTELADRYLVLNYGVGGYGLDQIDLLIEGAIDRWLARNPIVVIGVMIDDDLDRSSLTFRVWPKPHMRIVDDQLVVDQVPAPGTPANDAYHQLPTTSWGWRMLVHGSRRLPWNGPEVRGTTEQENAKVALNRKILERLTAALQGRKVEFFYVLFHYEPSVLHPSVAGWRSQFLRSTLDQLHAPWVATNSFMADAANNDPKVVASYFGGTNRTLGHFNALGNRVAFLALLDGLKRFAGVPVSDAVIREIRENREKKLLHVERFDEKVLRGKSAGVRYEFGRYREFPDVADTERLCVRVGEDGPTEVHWKLERRAHGFTARLEMYPGPGDAPNCGKAAVHFIADGVELASFTIARGEPEASVRVDLKDRENFSIVVDDAGDGSQCDTIVLLAPKLE